MHKALVSLKNEIKKYDKPENKIDIQRFFKEKLKNRYSLKGPIFKKIASTCFEDIRNLPKKEILLICDELLETDLMHNRGFAFNWANQLSDQFVKRDFARFERWLKEYVGNWGECDNLCCGSMGILIDKYPELTARVYKWTGSKNRWLKRASAVSLIVSLKNGKLLKEAFTTADRLLLDQDDMVQKGYGWMLKDASIKYPDEVFEFVLNNKKTMPRTALRYAIERYPQIKRKLAMKKD